MSHMIANRPLPKTLTYAIEHVTARYSSDKCYCLFKILKFKFILNLFFDLVVIRSSVLRHVTPIFHFHQLRKLFKFNLTKIELVRPSFEPRTFGMAEWVAEHKATVDMRRSMREA
jgi:hypothetical protein